MSTMQTKSLNTPDEIRTLPKTTVEVIDFGELSLMKLTFQPGWRWSEHVKPTAGTASCEVPHFNYGISGRLHVLMDNGTESEIGPGDAQLLPQGTTHGLSEMNPTLGLTSRVVISTLSHPNREMAWEEKQDALFACCRCRADANSQ